MKVEKHVFTFIHHSLLCTTRILDIDYVSAMGIYVTGFGTLKGVFNHYQELKVIYNFKRTRRLYKKIGFQDSLMELLSLVLVLLNSYLLSSDTLFLFELIIALFILAMLYRFLIWVITRTTRGRNLAFKKLE